MIVSGIGLDGKSAAIKLVIGENEDHPTAFLTRKRNSYLTFLTVGKVKRDARLVDKSIHVLLIESRYWRFYAMIGDPCILSVKENMTDT